MTELRDFFLDDYIFIAFGTDKVLPDDFRISDVGEWRWGWLLTMDMGGQSDSRAVTAFTDQ